jgi:hypothetical protein
VQQGPTNPMSSTLNSRKWTIKIVRRAETGCPGAT